MYSNLFNKPCLQVLYIATFNIIHTISKNINTTFSLQFLQNIEILLFCHQIHNYKRLHAIITPILEFI